MNKIMLKKMTERFLNEDIGSGDLSAELIFDENKISEGFFIAKTDGIIAGTDVIGTVYEVYGADVDVLLFKKDGDSIKKGEYIAKVIGNVRALLSCERVILNLLQRMSAIATAAKKAVDNLDDPNIRICDTRKTTPGLRMLEKYAVTCGGAFNHRMGLYDGVMLKDNHIAFAGGISEAVKKAREKLGHTVKIEVETETQAQVEEAVEAGADIIMFDNRTPEEIKNLIKLVPSNIITEASGGITPDNISAYKGCGVDYISLGALTHSVVAFDISFLSENCEKGI